MGSNCFRRAWLALTKAISSPGGRNDPKHSFGAAMEFVDSTLLLRIAASAYFLGRTEAPYQAENPHNQAKTQPPPCNIRDLS